VLSCRRHFNEAVAIEGEIADLDDMGVPVDRDLRLVLQLRYELA
jgi:hypothetical protein